MFKPSQAQALAHVKITLKHQQHFRLLDNMKILLVALTVLCTFKTGSSYKNVLGSNLQPCSTSGMALTGFTRNGKCVDRNDDAGSHHVCIDMTSTSGGNFCTVTGQPNWCGESMLCNDGVGQCKIENWCVCEWAFSS